MAIEVWKDVLHPGRHFDRGGRWVAFTAADTAAALRNVRAMLSRGWRIPCVWEHQPGAGPVKLSAADRLANYARHTFGDVTGARRDAAGVLWLRHRVDDPADAEQLRKTKFVSPKVYPSGYRDSAGNVYRGATVAHVASTPTPAQHWQKPFELSRADGLYLSYQREGDVADEKADDKPPAAPAPPEKEAPKPPDAGSLPALIEALRSVGHTIPDEVTDLAGLVIAIKAGGPVDKGGDLDDLGPGATTDAAAGGGPMLMSAAAAGPFADMARRDLEHRVKALVRTGRVPRPTALKLLQEAAAVELSFGPGGKPVPTALAARVEAYEALPKHSAWAPTHRHAADALELSATAEVDPPAKLSGRGKEQEAADWLTQDLPKPPEQK
jgi:hypothetical protein